MWQSTGATASVPFFPVLFGEGPRRCSGQYDESRHHINQAMATIEANLAKEFPTTAEVLVSPVKSRCYHRSSDVAEAQAYFERDSDFNRAPAAGKVVGTTGINKTSRGVLAQRWL